MQPLFDFFTGDNEQYVMSTLIPPDKEFDEIKERGEYILSPYTAFYGTKWDFTVADTNYSGDDEGYIELSVDTAWSPPLEFCRRLSDKYQVTVVNMFFEGGCNFGGRYEYKNGNLISSYDAEYDEAYYNLDGFVFWENLQYDDFEYDTEEDLLNDYKYITDENDKQALLTLYRYKQEIKGTV